MSKIQIIYEFVIENKKNVRLYLVQPDSLRFSSVVNYFTATTESNATVSAATTVESTTTESTTVLSMSVAAPVAPLPQLPRVIPNIIANIKLKIVFLMLNALLNLF